QVGHRRAEVDHRGLGVALREADRALVGERAGERACDRLAHRARGLGAARAVEVGPARSEGRELGAHAGDVIGHGHSVGADSLGVMPRTISLAVIPGDGIGPEVIAEALTVLRAALPDDTALETTEYP